MCPCENRKMYLSKESDVCCLDHYHFEATKFNLSFHSGFSSDPYGPGPSSSQPSSSHPKPSAEYGKKRRRKSEAPEWFEHYDTDQRRQMSELTALQKQAVEVARECNDILK
ncbi:hypothetical protein M9458_051751 [Cirrhinus mrigala]|uniref:Uncharacterized protein n=1 Tax=Cirrhinus mrigala TaxID=683832 RepID=A0ABD0MVT2_CIRMR